MRACKGTIEEITYLRQVYKMGLTSSAIDGVKKERMFAAIQVRVCVRV